MKDIVKVILGLCVSMPIWVYLLYQILVRVEASELMWFLFWIYVPVTFIVSVFRQLSDRKVG